MKKQISKFDQANKLYRKRLESENNQKQCSLPHICPDCNQTGTHFCSKKS